MLRGREHVRLGQCRDGESVPASSVERRVCREQTDDADGGRCAALLVGGVAAARMMNLRWAATALAEVYQWVPGWGKEWS